MKECEWTEDVDGNWETGCGETFVLIEGTPNDNKMSYCCYCGGELWEVVYKEPEVEEE